MKLRALFHISMIAVVLFFASRISALSNTNQDASNEYADGGNHVAWFRAGNLIRVCIGDGCAEAPIEYLCQEENE